MLNGKTVIVTGSRRGIGLSIAHAFAKQGANVVLNGVHSIPEETLKEFEQYEGSIHSVAADVSQYEEAKKLVDETIQQFGTVDILVNNAGITRDGLFIRMEEEDFNRVLSVNLTSCFNMMRLVSPILIKKRSGSIINLSSVVGATGNAGQANYAASKAGIVGLTKSVARELGSRGICVNAIAPGFIDTDMTQELSERVREDIIKSIPLKRLGSVEDIARASIFLATNPYITGQVLHVNGGMHMAD